MKKEIDIAQRETAIHWENICAGLGNAALENRCWNADEMNAYANYLKEKLIRSDE